MMEKNMETIPHTLCVSKHVRFYPTYAVIVRGTHLQEMMPVLEKQLYKW